MSHGGCTVCALAFVIDGSPRFIEVADLKVETVRNTESDAAEELGELNPNKRLRLRAEARPEDVRWQ